MHDVSQVLAADTHSPLPAGEKLGRVRGIAIATITLGLVVLSGWVWNIDALQRVLPGLVSMKANTAAAFAISGICLSLHTLHQTSPALLLARRIAAALVLLLGLATLAEYAFGWDAGIDQLLFSEPVGTLLTSHPGRMSTITAAYFALTGGALLLMEARLWVIAQTMAFAVAASVLLPLGGYMFGNLSLTQMGNTTAIAAHTAAGFLMLAAGILAATQGYGFMGWLRKKSLAIGLATSLATLIFIFGAASYNFLQKDKASQWVEHTYETILGMESFSVALHDFLNHNRGFLITGDDRQLTEKNRSRDAMLAELARVHQLTSGDPAQQERLAALGKLVGQRMEWSDMVVRVRREKGLEKAAAIVLSGRGDTMTDEIEAKLDELKNGEKSLLKERQRIAEIISASSLLTLGVLLVASLLLLLWVFRTSQQEITERRQVEEKLRIASLYARSLIEASLDPLVTISPEGKITDVNRATEEVTGRNRTALVGTDFSDYFTQPGKAREGYQQVFLNGFVTDYPLALRHRDGHVTDVLYNASVYRNEAGEVLGVFAAARDVTERNKAEAALRDALAQARRFAEALDNIPSYLYMKDLSRQYIYANKATLKLFNCSAEELIGSGDAKFFPPETVARLKAVDERVLEHGEATMEEIDVSPDSPARRVYLEVKYPIYDDAGKISGLCGISTDITEHKQLDEKIRQLNSELEQRVAARTAELEAANKELEAFSYSVSHDLRTPLRAIDGFSLMLLEDYGSKLDDEGKRLLKVVRNNTSRMARLIDDILRFSRAGRTEMSFSEIDMEGMAHGVIEELKPLVAGRKLQINLGSLPRAHGDRPMMHQVFENLLANAIKFTGKSEEARIDIGSRVEAGKAVYYVKDNGAGFDMQYAGKLFGVFQRLHGVDEFEGTGIGLAIVKRIIARHGGTVWAEGETGKGAAFYFSIPVNPEKNA